MLSHHASTLSNRVSVSRTLLAATMILVLLVQTLSPLLALLAKAVSVEPVPPITPNETEPLKPGKRVKPGDTIHLVKRPPISKPINKVFKPPRRISKAASNTAGKSSPDVTVVSPELVIPQKPQLLEKLNSSVYLVHLVTGDKLLVILSEGKAAIQVRKTSPHRIYHIVKAGDALYVIPSDVDLRKFSIDLFNVKELIQYSILGIRYLPLIVKLAANVPLDEQKLKHVFPVVASLPHMKLSIIHSVALRVPFDKLPEVYRELSSSPYVVRVELDRIVWAQSINSPEGLIGAELYNSTRLIGAPLLWGLGVNGSGVKIAVLDTGIDPSHPDFYIDNISKIVAAKSFVDYDFDGQPDEDVQDLHGHGTHCAGIAAGTGGYLPEIKGVAPGALLLVGKVLSNEGWGYDSWIIAGMEWAVESGANVISMSLGGPPSIEYDPMVEAVRNATSRGVIVVIAAGNEGPGPFTIASPGVAPDAITVGAVNKTFYLAWFSSWGPTPNGTLKPDVVAPGVNIASARANNTYMGFPASRYHVYASGTSMATPHVAGYAALVLELLNRTGILQFALSHNITIPRLVKDVIVSTATAYLNESPYIYGAGLINATNLAYLINTSKLIVVDPARTDVVVEEGQPASMLTIRMLNPWNRTVNLRVEPIFYKWPYTMAPINETIVKTIVAVSVENITLGPMGAATLNITINNTLLPLGYHALRLLLVDVDTNTTVAQVLIGISKPPIAVINVTYNGSPLHACAIAVGVHASGASISYGYMYGQEYEASGNMLYACGNGTIVLKPLYPDSAYLVNLYTFLEENTSEGTVEYYPANKVFVITTPSTGEQVVYVNQSFDNMKSIILESMPGEKALILAYDEAAVRVYDSNGSTVATTLMPIAWQFMLYNGSKLKWYLSISNEASPVAEGYGNYTAVVEEEYAVVEAFIQPLNSTEYIDVFNSTMPVNVFYRVYSRAPLGEIVPIKFTNTTLEMVHVHSAVSPEPLYEDSGMAVFCGPAYLSIIPDVVGFTGSQTLYQVDSNVDASSCAGEAIDWVYAGYVDMYAVDYMGYSMGGKLVYAPLRMPRGATIWSWFRAGQALDGYNFTGSYAAGHMFRTTITGYFAMLSYAGVPLTWFMVSPNCDPNHTVVASSFSTFAGPVLYWYMHGEIEPPKLCLSLTLNSDLIRAAGIGFFNSTASLEVYMESNTTHRKGLDYSAFFYGVGVREIVPVLGYDPLRNMLVPDSQAVLVVIFDRPDQGSLDTGSVEVRLVKGNVSIDLPIIAWDQLGPLPLAYVEVNTTSVEPGAYMLEISGRYIDAATGTSVRFELRLNPAVYIGAPAGKLWGPTTITVGPPGSGADYSTISEAVSEAYPGSTIVVLPGNYTEEMIVVDKPLKIVGAVVDGEKPRVVTPHGYPAFIIVAPAYIANLAIETGEGVPATVPPPELLPLPSNTFIPPAGIIAYNTTIELQDIFMAGYPRGVAVFGGGVKAANITVLLSPVFEVNGRFGFAKEPTPVYAYDSSLVVLSGVYSEELPVIRKTRPMVVGLEKIYIIAGNHTVPVDIFQGDNVIVSPNYTMYAAIVIGRNVLVDNATAIKAVEVVGDSIVIRNLTTGKLLVSAPGTLELSDSSAEFVRVESPNVEVYGLNVSDGAVFLDADKLVVGGSTLNGGVLVTTKPLARVSILGSWLAYGEPAALYAILADGVEFNFTGNSVCCSYYGLYIVPLYENVAPDIAIEANNFTNVVVPVYVAASPSTYYYYYPDYSCQPRLVEAKKPERPSQQYILEVFSDAYRYSDLTRIYVNYNYITNASRALVLNAPVAAELTKNYIEANETGIDARGVYALLAFLNNITAPHTVNATDTYGYINYNNLHGDAVIASGSFIDMRYNYITGTVHVDNTSEAVGLDLLYSKPVRIPSTPNIIIPIMNYIDEIRVGETATVRVRFLNPTPRSISFQYSMEPLGGITLSGETISSSMVTLEGLGKGYDTLGANITIEGVSAGVAALKVLVYTDTSYTLVLPFRVVGGAINMSIAAPATVKRGGEFNVTLRIKSDAQYSSVLIYVYQEGEGRLGFYENGNYFPSYLTIVNISKGENIITIPSIALTTGNVTVKAELYIGLLTVENSTTVAVEPNPQIAPKARIAYYPETLEQGDYSYIDVEIDNVTVETRILVHAESSSGHVEVLLENLTVTAYSSPWNVFVDIYGSSPGNDTVTIRVVDLDDNVTIFSGELNITVIPGYVLGYKAVYGYVAPALNTSVANITFPKTTIAADLWMYIFAEQSIASLKSLANMLEIPWGCVEQTTSPILAAIQLHKYLDKWGLWDAAAAAMASTLKEEFNVNISTGDDLKKFIVYDIIAAGVKRLIETHAQACLSLDTTSCGLGWYPGLNVDLFFTPYGLLGLLRAYDFGKKYNYTLYTNETVWLEVMEKLVRGLIEAQNSDGSWGRDYWTATEKIIATSFAAYTLAEAYRLKVGPYNESISVLEGSLLNATSYLEDSLPKAMKADDVSAVIAALYALSNIAKAGVKVNTTLLEEAVKYLDAKASKENGLAWWTGYWPYYGFGAHFLYLTTAKAAIAIYTVSSLNGVNASIALLAKELAENATRFLTISTDWLSARNTYESAAVLEAINLLGMEIRLLNAAQSTVTYTVKAGSPKGDTLFRAVIPVNSTSIWWYCYIPSITNVSSESVWCWGGNITVLRQGNWLEQSNYTLYIEVAINGNATASWFTDTYYLYIPSGTSSAAGMIVRETSLAIGSKQIVIAKQTVENSTASNYLDIEKSVTPQAVMPGDTVTVRLVVKSKSGTLSYIVVSDPIPKGFTLVNGSIKITPKGVATVDWKYYEESNHTALGFAIQELNETGVTIEYKLKVPENAPLGTIVAFDAANATFFYTPSGVSLTPAISNKPMLAIGVEMTASLKAVFRSKTTISNNTIIRWGEIINVTASYTAPSSIGLRLRVEILDENLTPVNIVETDKSWVLLVTSALSNLTTMEKLRGKQIYIVVSLVDTETGNIAAKQAFSLKLSEPTRGDFDDMLRALRLFWLDYGDQPWFTSVFNDILRGLRYTWLMIS